MMLAEQELNMLSICRRNGLHIPDESARRLRGFVEKLIDWNAKINLVSRKDTENIWYSHILHSLSLLFYIQFPEKVKVFDLGSGGGFPGIPISIVRNDLRVTLCDSIVKKTIAVKSVVDELQLSNVRVVTGRAEDVGTLADERGSYDVVVARAVAPLNNLIKWSKPLVKQGSCMFPQLIALKGGDLDDEIREATIKSKPHKIEVADIFFEGSVEIGLESKKIVKAFF